GDYVKHQFHYSNEPLRTYIVIAQPDPKRGYCESFMTECCFDFNMRDKSGSIINIPCYPDDNKIMLRESNIGITGSSDESSTWIIVQENEYTRRLHNDIHRLLINGDPYDIIGVNRLPSVKGITKVSIKNGTPHPKDDLINGIAYNELEEVNPPTPPPTTLEIIGSDTLSFDLPTTYTIANNTLHDTIWACDNASILFDSVDKNSCVIKVKYDGDLYYTDFKLKATIGTSIYEKVITIVD
ncbi:MAG: hypothetical protein ACRDD7_03465, partial [Peptostreptococcaceae bacterium]